MRDCDSERIGPGPSGPTYVSARGACDATVLQDGALIGSIDLVVIFGGGIPAVIDGRIVGAVGTSAGTVEQDISVAEAALAALRG